MVQRLHTIKHLSTHFLSLSVSLIVFICHPKSEALSPVTTIAMWSSSGGEETNNLNGKRVSSSSSKSSSSSSSPSPFAPQSHFLTPRRKTMEQVWKDINLASTSLSDHHATREPLLPKSTTTTSSATAFRGVILQDFLARPFSKDPPTSSVISVDPTTASDVAVFGSPAPPPPTVLSLNSGPEFHYLENTTDPLRSQSQLYTPGNSATPFFLSSLNTPFDPFAPSSAFSSFCKKRVPESDDSSGDRRHKRMIKNRESAARSRARKQAYTNELELEVAYLKEENAKLRIQQQELYLAAAAQLPKKHTLYRTSTAPF
ncbi:PREDICTED: protein FD-like isoform X2 [Nelumbo nucifera]|uniref:Protein FD-like isoform X2 n=1 Tax=Nelumbo nucifera TaxID=4432 RepID=A0A1U8AUJ7_NELNU|nr:PREDICTED: protein FD-like isoform X2 [Nelumbo nucifera]